MFFFQGNPDPIIKILGSEFSTVSPDNSTVIRMVDKNVRLLKYNLYNICIFYV